MLQKRVLPLFHYALKPGRFLFLGGSETVGNLSDLFDVYDASHRIYATKAVSSRITFDFSSAGGTFNSMSNDPKVARIIPSISDLKEEADRILLNRYAPPGVVINENFEILQFRGDTSRFLAPAPGIASLNLLKMAREGLLLELRAALSEAKETGQPARRKGVSFRSNNQFLETDLQVIPLRFADQSCSAVLFEEVTSPTWSATDERIAVTDFDVSIAPISERDRQFAQLNHELEAAKEYLQFNIERVESTNEELMVANEEVLSSNEELQSTNEELQTAKEELQASNEELNTVNEELRLRHREATQLGDDLSNLLRSIEIPIVMVGPDLRVRRYTPQAVNVFRLIASDLGRSIEDLNHNLGNVPLKSWIAQVLDSHSSVEHEVRDQAGRWFRLSVRPYQTKENDFDGVVLSVIDINNAKQSELQVSRARDFAETILDTVHIPLAILDLQRRIQSANPAFLDFFHVSRTETEQHFLKDVGNRQWDIPELDDLLSRTLSTGEVLKDYLVRHDFPTIGNKLMLLNAYRLDDLEGLPPGILLSIEDITLRERAIAIMREERSHESQKLESIGRVAGGIAHDFNNLLTIIFGYCGTLSDTLRDNQAAIGMLAQIQDAGERAARLTHQLLAYSRKQILQPRALDLNQLLIEMQSMLSRLVTENIRIETQLCPEPTITKIDPSQMEQVLMNLCLNARDAILDRGILVLETSHVEMSATQLDGEVEMPPGRYVRLAVRDNGVGMDADTLARIFEPFYTTKEHGKGTGLGLATVQGIIKQSYGHIEVSSQPKLGTTFTIYLPAVTDSSVPMRPALPVLAGCRQMRTILIVEDEAAIRLLVSKLLESPERRLLQAENGERALEVCRQHAEEIDLLITDVMMPGMSGYKLVGYLKSTHPKMKVLYISGHSEDLVRDQGVAIDQVAFLQKPFSPDVLRQKVAEELMQHE